MEVLAFIVLQQGCAAVEKWLRERETVGDTRKRDREFHGELNRVLRFVSGVQEAVWIVLDSKRR